MVSAIQIINALSSGKSLVVFDLISVEGGDKKSIIDSLRLSHKQYNSAISTLRKSGLVEKDYWQLKAIDAIRRELRKKERDETIEVLIDNQQIRGSLFRSTRPVIAKQDQRECIGSN